MHNSNYGYYFATDEKGRILCRFYKATLSNLWNFYYDDWKEVEGTNGFPIDFFINFCKAVWFIQFCDETDTDFPNIELTKSSKKLLNIP